MSIIIILIFWKFIKLSYIHIIINNLKKMFILRYANNNVTYFCLYIFYILKLNCLTKLYLFEFYFTCFLQSDIWTVIQITLTFYKPVAIY